MSHDERTTQRGSRRRTRHPHDDLRARRVKRALDLALTIPGLAVFLPVMLVLGILVRARLGTPVLFRQVRPGLHGRPFTIYKFRTMRDAVDGSGLPLPDAERLTPLGTLLRSTSLDELPELLNVARGDMSLVGPRPLLMQYLDRYTADQARRHEVKPGITGWTQVNGRNAIDWDRKFQLDVWYVDHWSVGLDLRILASTVGKTIRREGVSAPGSVTAEEFMGSEIDRGDQGTARRGTA